MTPSKTQMEEFTVRQATRQGVVPWIDLYSESGCGKTYSALLMARGLVGPDGLLVMLDSESGRGSLYADVPIIGGYKVVDIAPPFSPARYMAALESILAVKPAAVVVDSMSHEWEGIGGILDMAGDNEEASKKSGLHNWKTPKLEHNKLVQYLLRFPVPFICCIRAKYKTRQKKIDGKTVIVKDEVTSPIQAEDFIFEATAHAEILPDHSINLTKCSHPDLRACFPEKGPITIEHGQKIAEWCRKAGQPRSEQKPEKPAAPIAELQAKLWKLLANLRKPGDKSWGSIEGWLLSHKIITDLQTVPKLTVEELRVVLDKAEIVLDEQNQGNVP
jgi:hypothetical protein